MVLQLLLLILQCLLLALKVDVYLTKECGALLPELGDLHVLLMLLVGVTLYLCARRVWPPAQISSHKGGDARHCRQPVAAAVAPEAVLAGLYEYRGCWHVWVTAGLDSRESRHRGEEGYCL